MEALFKIWISKNYLSIFINP